MSGADQIAPIWSRAIKQYENITKKRLDDPVLKELTTVKSMLRMIEKENTSFDNFRSKGERFRTALEYALLPVELVSDLAASGAAMAFPPSSLIFASVTYLIQAANGVSEKYDAILEMMSTLKDFTIRLETYSQQQISSRLSTKLADILVTLLELLAFARQEIKQGRFRSYGKIILLGNDGANVAMAKLEKLFHGETALVGAETLSQTKGANFKIDRMQSDVTTIKTMLQSEPRKNQLIDKIKSTLQPTDHAEDRLSTINRSRVPNTGNWIHEDKSFEEWKRGSIPILWVCGTPGAGKSYIASNIISHLKDLHPQRVQHPSQVSVVYFFYKDDDSETRSVSRSLRDVAFQIALNDPLYARHVGSNGDYISDSATLSSLWRRLFVDYFVEKDELDSKVYIVLDALDEAFVEDRLELFDLLQDVQPNGRLQLLMLGRPHIGDEMAPLIELLQVPTIYVSCETNFQDIVHYIQASIAKSLRLRRLSLSLQSTIVTELSAGAQGMFIWVGFMLQELQRVRDHGGIRRALKAAPRGLSHMIRHVLKGFSELLKETPRDAEDLNELLAWVLCVPRPLKLIEVENILKWRNPDGEGWIRLEGDLRGQFASFFVLTREDRMTTAELSASLRDGHWNGNSTYGHHLCMDHDDEGLADFDSDPQTTEVTFNHASLGDYFRDENNGKVSAGEGFPEIGVNYHEAQALVLVRLFEIITNMDSPKYASADALRNIVYRSLTGGLEMLEPGKVTDENKRAIGLSLARILADESVFPGFFDPWLIGFYRQNVIDTFIKWLSDPLVQQSMSADEKSWYDEATAKSPTGILQRLTRYLATGWLYGEGGGVGDKYARCIRQFLDLESGHVTSGPESMERILEVAEWAGLEKTARWHFNVAEALRGFYLFDDALDHFQMALVCHEKAVELDPNLWLARWAMVVVCIDQGNHHRAIELGAETLEQLETMEDSDEVRVTLHALCETMGKTHEAVGDIETAEKMWEKAYQSDNCCTGCISKRLDTLRLKEDFQGCWAFWRELNESLDDSLMTRLIKLLLDLPDIYMMSRHGATSIIHYIGNANFFTEAYETAVVAARRGHKADTAAELEFSLGYLHSTHCNDPDKTIQIWEQLLDVYHGKSLRDRFRGTLSSVSGELGILYLTKYLQSNNFAEEALMYGTLLERLARGEPPRPRGLRDIPPLQEGDPFVTESPAGFNLGHFYKICGKTEAARQCYKAQIASCVRLLSDDDETNDEIALYRLGRALGVMDDISNALAAVYQFGALREQSVKSPHSLQFWACDNCGASCTLDGLMICCFCQDVGFCEECCPLIKSDQQPTNICGMKHELLYLPPRDRDVKYRSDEHKSMLYVDGTWVTLDDFKSQLKEKYGL